MSRCCDMQCDMMEGDGNTEPRQRKTNTGLSRPHQVIERGPWCTVCCARLSNCAHGSAYCSYGWLWRVRKVAFVFKCSACFPCCVGTERIFLWGAGADYASPAVHSLRGGQQVPGTSIPLGGSFDPLDGGPEYREKWGMHRAIVLSTIHESLVGWEIRIRQPIHLVLHLGLHNGVGPRRHRQVCIGKGFFDDTGGLSIRHRMGGAKQPPLKSPSYQVPMLL